MSYYQTVKREISFRSLMEIGKVGVKYFSCRLQPSQMCQVKMAVGVVSFILCIMAAFFAAKHFSLKPINALFVYGPVVMGVLVMAYASQGLSGFLEMRRSGNFTWRALLASKLADYRPAGEEDYQQLISSLLANTLTEEVFEAWLNCEYRLLCEGDVLVPDNFGKHDWKAMMHLSLRYTPHQ